MGRGAEGASAAAAGVAGHDLTHTVAKHLDKHLVLPLLEFLQTKGCYDDKSILRAKLALLEKTNMIDFAIDIYKLLEVCPSDSRGQGVLVGGGALGSGPHGGWGMCVICVIRVRRRLARRAHTHARTHGRAAASTWLAARAKGAAGTHGRGAGASAPRRAARAAGACGGGRPTRMWRAGGAQRRGGWRVLRAEAPTHTAALSVSGGGGGVLRETKAARADAVARERGVCGMVRAQGCGGAGATP